MTSTLWKMAFTIVAVGAVAISALPPLASVQVTLLSMASAIFGAVWIPRPGDVPGGSDAASQK
jgi:hypothetical protein